jgi:hypothetical protein
VPYCECQFFEEQKFESPSFDDNQWRPNFHNQFTTIEDILRLFPNEPRIKRVKRLLQTLTENLHNSYNNFKDAGLIDEWERNNKMRDAAQNNFWKWKGGHAGTPPTAKTPPVEPDDHKHDEDCGENAQWRRNFYDQLSSLDSIFNFRGFVTTTRIKRAEGILNEIIINVRNCHEFLPSEKAYEYKAETDKYIQKLNTYKNKLKTQ